MTASASTPDTLPPPYHLDIDVDMTDIDRSNVPNVDIESDADTPLSRDEVVVLAVGAGLLIATGAAVQYRRLIRK